ncbi:MAG: aldo/keto reductase [Gemmatimonadota bacterium]|nr:aldo/keto reductase [Gemmatimonadota bacterium]
MSGYQDDSVGRNFLSRRDFLRTAAMGAAGLGAFGSGALAAEEALTVNGLPGVVLGRTGLEVTKVSFGGMMISEPPVLLRAIDQGIKLVHTAPGYSNGNSMRAFGMAFKKSSIRDKVILALKERPENLDKCLKVLNTDYVDILVPPLHSVKRVSDPSIPEQFEKVRKAGKAGFMGFACHSQMARVLNKARELGYFDVTLMAYGNADNEKFLAAAKAANQAGIGIMTMKGLPKSISRKSDTFDMDTCASLCSAMTGPQHGHTVLASMSSHQIVDVYREVMETKLGYIDSGLERRYWAEQQGRYCSGCGNCEQVCSEGEKIKRIVRYRMYHQDYGLTDYARSKYAALGVNPGSFSSADFQACERVCPRGLPLKEMVAEAHSLLA